MLDCIVLITLVCSPVTTSGSLICQINTNASFYSSSLNLNSLQGMLAGFYHLFILHTKSLLPRQGGCVDSEITVAVRMSHCCSQIKRSRGSLLLLWSPFIFWWSFLASFSDRNGAVESALAVNVKQHGVFGQCFPLVILF